MVDRSSLFEFEPGSALQTCSAEDLMVLKLFAFRPRDVLDAETVAIRQRTLDWKYVETQLEPLADVKGQPEIMAALKDIHRKALRST